MSDDPAPAFESFGSRDDAVTVRTEVLHERGQWVVYLEVTFPYETRRFWIGAYRTERRARVAAEYVCRYADQDSPFPPTGF